MTELAVHKQNSVAISPELQPQHGSLRTNWHSQEGYVRLDSLSCAWSFYANRHRGFGTRSQPYLSSLRSCSGSFCWK
jgi:hypothetical protein